jgi:hypothetical protein
MEQKIDGSGNNYFDVENIRITCLNETWAGTPGLRIQAYKADDKGLFMGAEIPIPSKEAAFNFVKALFAALEVVGW